MRNSLTRRRHTPGRRCWGSWGNATKLWPTRFELFYPDYALGNFLAAVALTLSLGWDELDFNVPPAALLAAAGAAPLYTVGSLLLVAAVEMSGMVVAFPVVVGIEMLVGSTLLWVLERSEEPSLLFTGLVLVMAAVAFDALGHRELQATPEARQRAARRSRQWSSSAELAAAAAAQPVAAGRLPPELGHVQLDEVELDDAAAATPRSPSAPAARASAAAADELPRSPSAPPVRSRNGSINGAATTTTHGFSNGATPEPDFPSPPPSPPDAPAAPPLLCNFSVDTHCRCRCRCGGAGGPSTEARGALIAVLSGSAFAAWPLLAKDARLEGLSEASFFLAFNCFALVATALLLPLLMRYPLVGGRPLAFSDYRRLPLKAHLAAVGGGALWSVGTFMSLLASESQGLAVAMSITRCSPMVAALWGLALWGEGKGATRKARLYIGGMFLCYLAAIVCLAESSHKGELAEALVDVGLANATVLEGDSD